ncbi:MAG: erythromycin esterase [Saprospiraceae bacterium]|mgnify:CR=1 FL=1|jgi:erythromycin esterase
MRIFINFLSIVFCVFILSCNSSNQYKENIYDVENPDFSFLKEALKGKRIVALGESSLGYGDLQSLKGKMVQYLHDELDYDVFIMDAGYGDAKICWENINLSDDGAETKGNSLNKNSRSEEFSPLFKYIKDQSETDDKLIYTGYDTKISGNAFNFKLGNTINRVEIKIIQDSITSGIESFNTLFRLKDSFEFQYHKNKSFAGIDLAILVLNDNREEFLEKEIATKKELDILLHTLDYLHKSSDIDFGEANNVGLALRDSLMAENVINQIKTEYSDKKIILWGHNGRIEKSAGEGDNIKWMGHYLVEEFGDDYYAMGMYCKKGNIFAHWKKTNQPFDINEEGFIEKTLFDINQSGVFVNLPKYQAGQTEWFHNQINGYEPEAGGKVFFIPSKRFDGVLLLPETSVPTFISKSTR